MLEIGRIIIALIFPSFSQGKLASLLNDGPEGYSSSKFNMDQRKEPEGSTNPFSRKRTPRESKDNFPKDSESSQMPPGLPALCEGDFRSLEEISLNEQVPLSSVTNSQSLTEISLIECYQFPKHRRDFAERASTTFEYCEFLRPRGNFTEQAGATFECY